MKELQAMVGYTVISNDEYRNLILENKELKKSFENSSSEDSTDNKFEKYFLDTLYKDNNHIIRNLEFDEDGRIDTTRYYYSELQIEFLKIGIDDLNYIYNRICEFYQRYKEDQKLSEKNDK